MTDAPTEIQVDALDLVADAQAPDVELDDGHFLFTLSRRRPGGAVDKDPRVLTCRRPKGGWWIKMMRQTGNGAADLDTLSLIEQVAIAEHFTQILPPEDRAYLVGKFENADDDWDYDMLIPVIKAAQERWFATPTGKSAGSSPTPRRTGSGSTGRSRSAAQTRARSPKTGS